MTIHNNWIVQDDIYPLFKFVLPMFEDAFGKSVMTKEPCAVLVDVSCPTAPLLAFNPTRIILTAGSTFWCQVVYQLSHELTHYAIRQYTNYQYTTCASSAFEEPACEAMSLFILKRCSEQWTSCDLYTLNAGYARHFESYRMNIYNVTTGELPQNISDWTSLCSQYTGLLIDSSQRPKAGAMRNTLYDAFIQYPKDIGLFIKYPLYMRTNPYEVLIDETKWQADEPSSSEFINAICSVQPNVA